MLCHKPAICGDCVRAHGAVQQGRLAGYGITPYGPPPYQSHRVHRNLKEVWRAAPVIPCAAQHLGHYKATAAATRNTLSAHRNISESAVIQPDGSAAPGKCWLAGVGPGSWDHVTVSGKGRVGEGAGMAQGCRNGLTAPVHPGCMGGWQYMCWQPTGSLGLPSD